jgi:16S rRNA processing protein RimM
MRLLSLSQDESRRELQVETLWPHKGLLVLKFAGVNSISEAELLVGCELQVPREERAQLDAGWTYISDLLGCKVFDQDREIGVVEDVRFGAGEAPLLVVNGAGRQYELPYAQAYLKGVDLGQKRIDMLLPEGILGVNVPMTAEEKQHHRETRHARKKR